jgi:transcriptional regulator with XRE-family HTH domain
MTTKTISENAMLRAVRTGLRLSQDGLAREIRLAGDRIGAPNTCSKRLVQRWESGEVSHPHPDHLRALEAVTGLPASNLGFAWPVDGAALESAPAGAVGALGGIWLSRYEYPSSGRGGVFVGWHHVALVHTGDGLQGRSLAASSTSTLVLSCTVAGQVVTGTWTEHTSPDSYYRGAVYHGAIQLLADPTGRRLAGEWVGFGRSGQVNHGPWELTLRDKSLSKSALARWDRRPVEAGDGAPDETRP